jgi:hypothetical protein
MSNSTARAKPERIKTIIPGKMNLGSYDPAREDSEV